MSEFPILEFYDLSLVISFKIMLILMKTKIRIRKQKHENKSKKVSRNPIVHADGELLLTFFKTKFGTHL